MPALTSILLTALAAFAGAPLWVALIGAGVLFSISYREQRRLAMRFANISGSRALTAATWPSAGHALFASSAAFALGFVSRWALSL
jgi:hypothetical protein